LGGELVRLVRLIERSRVQFDSSRGGGLEHTGHFLLARLVDAGPQRLSALAEAVHSDPSTVSRQVANLVQLALVERRQDQLDGRASLLAATESGHRAFDKHRQARIRHITAMLASWSTGDVRQLVGSLERLNRSFEDYRDRLLAEVAERRTAHEREGMTS
jgi:DNA-binding MarR family transcriptional regulator